MNNLPAKRILKGILKTILVIFVLALAFGAYYINTLIPIITGYPAKFLCSAAFVSGREQAEVEAMDLNFSFIKYVKSEVNLQDSSVTSRFLWGKSKAIYREGFGATLLRDVDEAALRAVKFPNVQTTFHPDTLPWPVGNIVPDSTTGIDFAVMDELADKVMSGGYNGHAFAFLVLHKGVPVAEAYQPEFNSSTRFLSWSVAKSFTNALAGIMVKDGTWDINQPAAVPEWQADDRKNITLNNLLQMQSGLRWNEDYGNRSDVTVMLYCENDFAKFAYSQPLENQPGTKWYYSSGTVNILNYLMRRKIGNDEAYYRFAKTRLFDKLGMNTAVFETDASGTQVGSSYVYATARDYARFGLLYLNGGVFNGERILPEGWVNYTTTQATDSNGDYGALFWLNKGGKLPSVPADMYSCNGHDGQQIYIIPSKELVVVVLGYSPKPDKVMNFDLLLSDVISTVGD